MPIAGMGASIRIKQYIFPFQMVYLIIIVCSFISPVSDLPCHQKERGFVMCVGRSRGMASEAQGGIYNVSVAVVTDVRGEVPTRDYCLVTCVRDWQRVCGAQQLCVFKLCIVVICKVLRCGRPGHLGRGCSFWKLEDNLLVTSRWVRDLQL